MPAFHLRPADMLRAYAQEIEQIYNSIKETLFFLPLIHSSGVEFPLCYIYPKHF